MALGTLLREGFQVPPGFTVTTTAYREHVDHNHLSAPLGSLLDSATTFEAHEHASAQIRHLFESSEPSPRLQDEILAAYDTLSTGQPSPTPVAVRSSATAEDLADASFAGQQETYLWIMGGSNVLQHVVRCWASLFTPQAISYRAQRHASSADDLAMGVVVQLMVPAEAAGVMLTIDPVTGDGSQIVIEASYGLGTAVVNGEVNPDRFSVDKLQLEIRDRSIGDKAIAYRFDPAIEGTRREDVPRELQSRPCVTDEEILQLATLGKRMEHAMRRPQDMEWAIAPGGNGRREISLLQARPETVWSQTTSPVGLP
jgi:phosphoenolpyruvate synthase/pyruvate phosphate dikinase